MRKRNTDVFSNFVFKSFNNSIQFSTVPVILKQVYITPLYKKCKKDIKGNYRPVIILPNLSKIFEKFMFEQMSQFFENRFSKYQCGFRKCFSTQPCLLAVLGKQERSVDNKKILGTLLTGLSKAFDCLNHKLLIAELKAYGFSLTSLKLIHKYR